MFFIVINIICYKILHVTVVGLWNSRKQMYSVGQYFEVINFYIMSIYILIFIERLHFKEPFLKDNLRAFF